MTRIIITFLFGKLQINAASSCTYQNIRLSAPGFRGRRDRAILRTYGWEPFLHLPMC